MNTFKKLYKQFFGLNEQSGKDGSMFHVDDKDVENMKKMPPAAQQVKSALTSENEELVDEARLINHITDYRGGVEFIMRDPSDAVRTTNEIIQWAEKKGFTVVKKQISKTGKVVYIYFRLGEDPGSEAQKIQGYLSQMPELKHFRFNVKDQQTTPARIQRVPFRKI